MQSKNLLDPQDLVDQLLWQDAQRAAAVRRKAQKDSRIKKWYDRILLSIYTKLVDWTAWNQKRLQSLINQRNKYSETYVVHDSHRVFAEMMQGDQLEVLKELSVISAKKIDDGRLLITFGEVTRDEQKFTLSDNGMFIIVEAINENGAPFLKIGMDTWEQHHDSARNN